jgi:hypothetical protein
MPGLSIGPYEGPVEARRERHFSAGPEGDGGPAWGDGIYLGTFLILSLQETDGGLSLIGRGVFDRVATGKLVEDFEALLAAVVDDPNRPLSALGGPRPAAPAADGLDVRGFRISPARTEAALARCRGVAEVTVAVRADASGEEELVANVVGDGSPQPTLSELRHALWAERPGALWPAAVVTAGAHGRATVDDPLARTIAAMWSEVGGRAADVRNSYWQDFTFLAVLAEMREAGLAVSDEQVVHCRTPEMLAVALRAART